MMQLKDLVYIKALYTVADFCPKAANYIDELIPVQAPEFTNLNRYIQYMKMIKLLNMFIQLYIKKTIPDAATFFRRAFFILSTKKLSRYDIY